MQKFKDFWNHLTGWAGWSRLLYPHPVLVAAMAAVSAAGLTWVFTKGEEQSAAAYLCYPLSAYALATVLALALRRLRAKKQAAPKTTKPTTAFGLSFYREQLVNFCYGGFKILQGAYLGSAWIGADGIYNFLQGAIQLYQLLGHRKDTTLAQQWKTYRNCGWLMLLVNLTMTGMLFQMIHLGRHEDNSEVAIITTATFAFYKLTKAIIEVARDRKHKNPVDSAVYFLDLGQALYNLFVLQVGLLWVFGAEDPERNLMMNSLTGTAVCLLVCGIGIHMLLRSKRDMKKLEEPNV